MAITKKTIERAYELLRELPPFNKWSLPPKSKVEFGFAKEKNVYGIYFPKEGSRKHRINVCRGISIPKLTETLAHEMIHLKQCVAGRKIQFIDSQADWHDKEFRKLARKVCKQQGYKLKEF